ncbi:hypothetical protein LBMAG42_43740 [Deltaproteobacteria bacterium]|nr:hypothetical protein LBMAG42_43740 [Deltaproteobacteria bacterium]
MPWIVELKREPAYPPVCPYCRKRPTTTTIHVPHKQATGFYAVAATYQNYAFFTPSCAECARAVKRLQVASVLLCSVPWAFWFALPFVAEQAVAETWETLALVPLALTVVGIGLSLWRSYRLRTLRILHVGQGGITYGFAHEGYAKQFAAVNGTDTTWKLLVIKLV